MEKKIRIRDEINEMEISLLFCEKVNKIDPHLAKLTKRKREETQTNIIRDEKEDITTNTKEIQRTIKEYFENLHSNKLENLAEMDKYL
jgi:hypothetical protein